MIEKNVGGGDCWSEVRDGFAAFTAPASYYRIKPEPVECWAVVRHDGKVVGAFDSHAQADSYHIAGRIIRMREV